MNLRFLLVLALLPATALAAPWSSASYSIATDTADRPSAPATASIVVQTNSPPVARLAASQLLTPALTVRADRDPTAHGEIVALRDAWRRLGAWPAVLLSALLFGLAHASMAAPLTPSRSPMAMSFSAV